MKLKEETEKSGLKLNIQKIKIMASGPITSWLTDGDKVDTMAHFIFLGSIITADGDCSHEIKRCLFLGRKAMTNLGWVLKSRDIILTTKLYRQYGFCQKSGMDERGEPLRWLNTKELMLLNCGAGESS